MPDEVFSMVWGKEWYIRVRPEVDGAAEGARESGLMVDAGPAGDDGEGAALGGRVQR
jgi:hypothetical protein